MVDGYSGPHYYPMALGCGRVLVKGGICFYNMCSGSRVWCGEWPLREVFPLVCGLSLDQTVTIAFLQRDGHWDVSFIRNELGGQGILGLFPVLYAITLEGSRFDKVF